MRPRKVDPAIAGLDADDRDLLIAALTALRAERGRAWNAACDHADLHNRPHPRVDAFAIAAIVRLARRLGGEAPHWLDG